MAYPETYTHGYEPDPEDDALELDCLVEQIIERINREIFGPQLDDEP